MQLLAFDGRLGASGDMILGALLDAGGDPAVLEPVESALDLEYVIESQVKCGIEATDVTVVMRESDEEQKAERDGHDAEADDKHGHRHDDDHSHGHEHGDGGDHGHSHDHGHTDGDDHSHSHGHTDGDDHSHSHGHTDGDDHSHSHGHNHSHSHTHTPAEGHGPNRSYREVCQIIREMNLEPAVETDALAVVELLGEAEASVHGTGLDDVHFHEVGADDAIADIVGATLLLADLEPDRIVTTPLSAGGGSVSMSHGEYPVPTPAVVEIAERADWALRGGPLEVELLTPTGAAILGHFALGVDAIPALEVDRLGYGAGGYDLDPHPNVLRVLGGTAEGSLLKEDITVLETNLDDATPEVLGGLQIALADAGARDVSVLPVTMKKSRPGHLVKVICKPEDRERVARALAEETGTLGVRDAGATHRWIANRRFETVELVVDGTAYEVTVKIASDSDGTVYDVSAEYDDAKAVATETGRAVREIIRRAEAIMSERLDLEEESHTER